MSDNWTLALNDIRVEDRMRREMGDIDAMAASIKEFGLIQPIVLSCEYALNAETDKDTYRLVVGGRRIAALRKLGFTSLTHGQHFLLRGEQPTNEQDKLKLASIELEENLRRKEMTWHEQVEAKAKLMEMMVKIHGETGKGGLTREEKRTGEVQGFGVRKLAVMLGESVGTVSQDLQLAKMVKAAPQLKNNSSKSVAFTQGTGMLLQAAIRTGMVPKDRVAAAAAITSPMIAKPIEYRVLVFVNNEQEQKTLMAELMQRGLKCQAVIV